MSSEKIAIDGKFGGSGMTVGEAITRFKQAKDRRAILNILSDESGLTVDLIKSMFVGAGVDYKLFPRARRKPDLPEVKPEDAERLQAERDRPKPPGRPKTPEPADVVELSRVNDQINKVLELVSRATKGENDG